MAGLVTADSIVVPDKKLEDAGIHVFVGEVTKIDTDKKRVRVSDGSDFSYDKLFLSTGSSSLIPPLEGNDLTGVMFLRGLSDAEKIKAYLSDNKPKKLIFVGAGFITMEIASLLMSVRSDGYDITVLELFDRPLPLMLDKDMADPVQEYLAGKGVKVITGEMVEKVLGKDGAVAGVELGSGKKLDADMVFINVGVRPNMELAQDIGLEIGQYGIKVNEFQETSDPDILAGGDCVEKVNYITRKPDPGRLRGPAVMQGRLAAKRLAGYDIEFPGVINAGGCRMFDLVVSATGLTEEAAAKEGFETVCSMVDSRSKHGMIPGMKPWRIKLVFDRKTQKIIGGQIVSHEIAPAREIDAVSAFILGGKTISDLTTFTSACNPDISSEPSLEPITIAAEHALQQLRKM
ncbi:MAG: FAD-dependent oxidoreductase [Desulfobacterales bacterium]